MRTRREILLGGFASLAVPFVGRCSPIKSLLGAEGIENIQEDKADITAASYVQDGLLSQYDGIENYGYGTHDDSIALWKDLKGGRDATIQGDCYWNSTSLHRNPVSSAKIFLPDIHIQQGLHIEYFSAVYNLGSGNFRDICSNSSKRFEIIQNSTSRFGALYMNANGGNVTRAYYAYVQSAEPKTTSLGFDDQGLVISMNGVYPSYDYTVNTPLSNTYYGLQTLSLGSFGSLFEDADFYSIRIYSRVLTPQEIAYNAEIDKERFSQT